MLVFTLLLTLWNVTYYFPKRFAELPGYAGVTAELKREVRARELQRAVVFVWTEKTIYNEGFFLNDPFMNGNLIFAVDLGQRNHELLAKYPDFAAYRWTRDKRLVPLELASPRGGPDGG